MTTTENYGLKKPESNDYVSIDVINENMDAIDEKLKENEDHSSNTSNPHKVTKSQVGLGCWCFWYGWDKTDPVLP